MKKFDIVVCYDLNTTEEGGKRRLRKVAKVCEAHGQRVQWSVFECSLTPVNYEMMLKKLRNIMDPKLDSLRIYVLQGSRTSNVYVHGRDTWIDFDGSLVI